jgi:hypothetical protein
VADERSVAVGSELPVDVWNELLDEESREELLVTAQVRTAIDLIDADHDLWRRGVVVSITDDVVARGGDGDVEELSHVAIEEIRRLVPSPCDAVVRR